METMLPAASVTIRQMIDSDLSALNHLIHSAYRGGKAAVAWKNEHDLVRGRRIDEDGLGKFLNCENALVLVAERSFTQTNASEHQSLVAYSEHMSASAAPKLCGSVLLERESHDSVLFGMLSVDPDYQNIGLGRQLVVAAEAAAIEIFKVNYARMHVISVREELLNWYKRLGYTLTGALKQFPGADSGIEPLQAGLQFAVIEKNLV